MKISYCIPILNRFDDIKSTLYHNIDVIRKYRNEVELIIHCFDVDSDVESWINKNFIDSIQSGLLKFRRMPTLKNWHFCEAKNSFKIEVLGTYYSSLDGDNFLDVNEITTVLGLLNSYPNLLIHHFSGQWGDGTSGRITLPSEIYKSVGYDNSLFPRQFDELALIMAVLKNHGDIVLVTNPDVYIEQKSNYFGMYIEKNNIKIKRIEANVSGSFAPLLPRGAGYVAKDPKLSHYQDINGLYAMAKNSRLSSAQSFFERVLKSKQTEYFDRGSVEVPITFVFDINGKHPFISNELTVYSVVKNDHVFLNDWYHHYVGLGVSRFFIVDDGSIPGISEVLDFPNVFVFRPKVGSFKYFKTYWIRYLMLMYQLLDSWVITIDSDEFIDLHDARKNRLPEFISNLPIEQNYVAGVMLDMAPESEALKHEDNFIAEMKYHLMRPPILNEVYRDNPTIKWGFGDFWHISYSFDLRYRYFNTIDSLRKFPIFKYTGKLELNQGFHDIKLNDVAVNANGIFSGKYKKIVIKHYKLLKLFSTSRYEVERHTNRDGYFGRTAVNIDLAYKYANEFLFKSWPYSPYKTLYDPKAVTNYINTGIS